MVDEVVALLLTVDGDFASVRAPFVKLAEAAVGAGWDPKARLVQIGVQGLADGEEWALFVDGVWDRWTSTWMGSTPSREAETTATTPTQTPSPGLTRSPWTTSTRTATASTSSTAAGTAPTP